MGERPRYYADGTWHLGDTHSRSSLDAFLPYYIVLRSMWATLGQSGHQLISNLHQNLGRKGELQERSLPSVSGL